MGISPAVTNGILEAFRAGGVTSASLMANAPGFNDAVEKTRSFPGLAVGLHFNLTAGRPLSALAGRSSLVGPDGMFRSLATLMAREAVGLLDRRAVRAELDAQLGALRRASVTPAHINSHHHVHFLPSLLPVVTEAARELGIPFVRGGKILRAPGSPRPATMATCLRDSIRTWSVSRTCSSSPLDGLRADWLAGLESPPPGSYSAALGAWLEGLRPGVTELVCHPGRVDPMLAEIDGWVEMREEELAALCSSNIPEQARRAGVTLASAPA